MDTDRSSTAMEETGIDKDFQVQTKRKLYDCFLFSECYYTTRNNITNTRKTLCFQEQNRNNNDIRYVGNTAYHYTVPSSPTHTAYDYTMPTPTNTVYNYTLPSKTNTTYNYTVPTSPKNAAYNYTVPSSPTNTAYNYTVPTSPTNTAYNYTVPSPTNVTLNLFESLNSITD
jgi:hypothetical protein